MSVYTVHQPPLRAKAAAPDLERFAFVRDGFSLWAFLFAPFWMVRHRLWLVLAAYLLISAGVEAALVVVGASAAEVALVAALIAILVGLEASTLRRLTLAGMGWENVGVVSGDDREDAERRFFDAWLRRTRSQPSVPLPDPAAASSLPPAAIPRAPPSAGIIGLFPEPGADR